METAHQTLAVKTRKAITREHQTAGHSGKRGDDHRTAQQTREEIRRADEAISEEARLEGWTGVPRTSSSEKEGERDSDRQGVAEGAVPSHRRVGRRRRGQRPLQRERKRQRRRQRQKDTQSDTEPDRATDWETS